MNKFFLSKCTHDDGTIFEGESLYTVCLTAHKDYLFNIFFPVQQKIFNILDAVFKDDQKELKKNQDIMTVFETMIETWTSGDRYMAGILIDMEQSEDGDVDGASLVAKIIISYVEGMIDGFVNVSFANAMVLAALTSAPIFLTDPLFVALIPDDWEKQIDEGVENADKKEVSGGEKQLNKALKEKRQFPYDKEIVELARQLLDGEVKDDTQLISPKKQKVAKKDKIGKVDEKMKSVKKPRTPKTPKTPKKPDE